MILYVFFFFFVLPFTALMFLKWRDSATQAELNWHDMPFNSDYTTFREVVMPFKDFIKYYSVAPQKYEIHDGYHRGGQAPHPVYRDGQNGLFVVNFPSLAEYKAFVKWTKKGRTVIEQDDNLSAFLDGVRNDIENVQNAERAKVQNVRF